MHDSVALGVVIRNRRILQGIHDVLQLFCDNGVLEVNHQHRDHLVQPFLIRHQLLCFGVILAQLIPVTRQFGGYRTDFRIGVRHEEAFGSELLIVDMFGGLREDTAVEGIMESQFVLLQVIDDILDNGDRDFVALFIR